MSSQPTLKMDAFNIKRACSEYFNAIIVGKKNTGKSTVIQDIMYYLYKTNIPRVVVFSGTEQLNGFYKNYVPETYIYDGSKLEEKLKEIEASQKDLAMRQNLGEIDSNVDLRLTIILDDLGYARKKFRTEIVRLLFMNGRHYHISMIIACQNCMDIGSELRTNADYIYTMQEQNDKGLRNLFENYFNNFSTKKDFKTVLNACTKDYGCMIKDNTQRTTEVQSVCFWYKAKYGRKFHIGSREFWDFHKKWHITLEQQYLKEREMKKKGDYSKEDGLVVKKIKKKR